jgi:glycosyltransferase involved in cell wall biosynthesis
LGLLDSLSAGENGVVDCVLFCLPETSGEFDAALRERLRDKIVIVEQENDIRDHIHKCDVYFCPFGVLLPERIFKPAVVMLPDIQEAYYPEFFSRGALLSRYYHHPASTRAADRVLTVSEFSRRSIVEHHGISAGKIDVAAHYASEAFHNAERTAQAATIRPPFERFILYPANRWHHKNHDILLRALALLRQRDTRVRVNAVFTGHEVSGGYPLLEKAREYEVSGQIWNAGHVSEADLAWLYWKADMLVFPSLFEGFGMPPLEAMAAGCPVAASSSTALPETCGDAALYFDARSPSEVAAAIERLLGDESLRDELIERGRARAGQFSRERMIGQHIETFRKAINSYSPARTFWYGFVRNPAWRAYVLLRSRLPGKGRIY